MEGPDMDPHRITWCLSLGRYHLLVDNTVAASETDMQPNTELRWTGDLIKAAAQNGGYLSFRDGILYLDTIPLTQVGMPCRDGRLAERYWTEELLRKVVEGAA